MIWIDGKNPALYDGGISHWLETLLNSLDIETLSNSTLVYPNTSKSNVCENVNINRLRLPWFSFFSNRLNQAIYDYFIFYFFSFLKRPKVIFSPYYDVRVPKSIPVIFSIHDLCYLELPEAYPRLQIWYYKRALRRSVSQAKIIITVSTTTKNAICKEFDYDPKNIYVIPNQLSEEFRQFRITNEDVIRVKSRFSHFSTLILYSGGAENRKNLPNLASSFELLVKRGWNPHLLITSDFSPSFKAIFESNSTIKSRTTFLGKVTVSELKILYSAADIVVYPSQSEGFGRSCIEAMSVGTPLAVSNIPSLVETAGGYAHFFDPSCPTDIANVIEIALLKGKRVPIDTNSRFDLSDIEKLNNALISLNSLGVAT